MPRADSEPRTRLPAFIAGAIFLLPVLYVLSIGPTAGLALNKRSGRVYVAIYAPILWAAERSETVSDILYAYMQIWYRIGVPDHVPTGP